MSRVRAVRAEGDSRPPTFCTNVDVSDVYVDIQPDELEEAGWVYVGDGASPLENRGALAIVRDWHDANHTGPWEWCQHEPCHEIVRVSG